MSFGVGMKRIVFLGSKEIGFECLKILYSYKQKFEYSIIGTLTNHRGSQIEQFCIKKNIPILNSLDEYLSLENIDIAISVQYDKILKPCHIKKPKDFAINLHMAPLPEYRGCNQFSFAIVEQAKEFGTTIHIINEKIDRGDILFEDRFPIPQKCWVSDLYKITFRKSVNLFESSLEKIVTNKIEPKDQLLYKERKSSIHFRKEIEELKCIDLGWDKEKIERHIRATSMPNYEPPFTIIDNQKIYLKGMVESL